ncbi:ferredoxin family protein [Chlamydiota bacterium]
MPFIEINKDLCKGCSLCIISCPRNLIALSKDFNKKGVQYALYQRKGECTGCSLCALMCPDVAICIYKKESELNLSETDNKK